jgi:hypothetical protein
MLRLAMSRQPPWVMPEEGAQHASGTIEPSDFAAHAPTLHTFDETRRRVAKGWHGTVIRPCELPWGGSRRSIPQSHTRSEA